MNSTSTFIQRFAAGLSARALAVSASVVAQLDSAFVPSVPAFAVANPASGNASTGHMNIGWLGGFAETGCAKTAYATKRISSGSLCEVST